MSIHDDLGSRMKTFYEEVPKTHLMHRCPVAIRIDGKAFHTFTRGFIKPFDVNLMRTMARTTLYLCQNIQGCVFGYTESDEITLILIDYQNLDSSAWFDYEVQKLCSIAASMATMKFNKIFADRVTAYCNEVEDNDDFAKYCDCLTSAVDKGAIFDARCFNIPKEEVTNLIYWRQLDATRNSIQMVGQNYFSHRELQNKSCNDIQDMLLTQRDVNWNNYPTSCKRGTACKKIDGVWTLDYNMPILKNENRGYVDDLIYVGE